MGCRGEHCLLKVVCCRSQWQSWGKCLSCSRHSWISLLKVLLCYRVLLLVVNLLTRIVTLCMYVIKLLMLVLLYIESVGNLAISPGTTMGSSCSPSFATFFCCGLFCSWEQATAVPVVMGKLVPTKLQSHSSVSHFMSSCLHLVVLYWWGSGALPDKYWWLIWGFCLLLISLNVN